jgi:hypothetical protein
VPAPPAAPAGPSAPRTPAWTASGLVTLATLATLLVLPFWVFGAASGEWESRLATFKSIALALTVLYFVAGVLWMNENEKRRALGRR